MNEKYFNAENFEASFDAMTKDEITEILNSDNFKPLVKLGDGY